MKCKDCDYCREIIFNRWSSIDKRWIVVKKHQCWGVAEPFVIKDINTKCTEYPELRDKIREDINIEKVIKHFEYGINHNLFEEPVTSDVKIAVEAMKKQISKKIVYKDEDECGVVYCPCCENVIGCNEVVWNWFYCNNWKPMYCTYCGQAMVLK